LALTVLNEASETLAVWWKALCTLGVDPSIPTHPHDADVYRCSTNLGFESERDASLPAQHVEPVNLSQGIAFGLVDQPNGPAPKGPAPILYPQAI